MQSFIRAITVTWTRGESVNPTTASLLLIRQNAQFLDVVDPEDGEDFSIELHEVSQINYHECESDKFRVIMTDYQQGIVNRESYKIFESILQLANRNDLCVPIDFDSIMESIDDYKVMKMNEE